VELSPEDDTGTPEYEIEEILDSRHYYGKVQYWIRWKGYGPEHEGWVYGYDVEAPEAIEEFHRRNPQAVREDLPRKGRLTRRR